MTDAEIAQLENSLSPWTRELLACLTPRRRAAFVVREATRMTFDEIGEHLDISPSRANQLHAAAERAITEAARRAAQLTQHVPRVVDHPAGGLAQRCVVPEEMASALTMSIDALALGVRAANCLLCTGIRNIRELVTKSESELLRIPNMGRITLREIREALAGIGLHLGMTVPGLPPPTLTSIEEADLLGAET